MSSKHAAEEATGTEPADKKPRTEETAGSAGAQNASDGASGPGLFDHLSLPVSDYKKSKEFYSGVLGVLGCTVQMEFGEGCGIGKVPLRDRLLRFSRILTKL